MKFAKTLERELSRDIPEEWVEAAIKYKALKKCINKVVDELKFLGLELNKLKLLINDKEVDMDDNQSTSPSNPIIAEYTLTKASPESHTIKPILKITLDFSNESLSDDTITKTCNEIKQKIESLLNDDSSSSEEEKIVELKEEDDGELRLVSSREGSLSPPLRPLSPTASASASAQGPIPPLTSTSTSTATSMLTPVFAPKTDSAFEIEELPNTMDKLLLRDPEHKKREIYIVLNSDSKFFKMLDEELEALDYLRRTEEKKLINEVQSIAHYVSSFTGTRSEMYKWRELFKIYLDSEVYFQYNDQHRSPRSGDDIKAHLDEFMNNVNKSGLIVQFKKKKSLAAFEQFVSMNYHLLKMLQFQSINTEALRKILKKFDKQTSLGIQTIYPKLISSDHIFVSGKSLAQSICYVIQNSVIQIIPQIDDYSCPICMSIAYKPIRLSCGHLFCVRCLVKLKKDDKTSCPMCRMPDAILEADSSNLDLESMEIMKKYFPIEVREKLRDREKERYNELKGNAKGEKCTIV